MDWKNSLEKEEENERISEEITPCMICQENPHKYKCPGCSLLTCSLECCKAHKVKFGCTGSRDRTAYVPIQSFGDQNLRNDYHFLEDVIQTRSSAHRTLLAAGGSETGRKSEMKQKFISKSTSLQDILSNSSRVNNQNTSTARFMKGGQSHGVQLSLMPNGMSKRISNTSRYHKNIDKIFWKVHIIFVLHNEYNPSSLLQYDLNGLNSNSSLLGLTSSNEISQSLRNSCVDEETTISEMISQFLSTTSDQLAHRHHLRYLRSKKDSLKCVLHKIPSSASRPIFHEIPMEFSLKNALSGKRIIEYPTFVVGPIEFMEKIEFFVKELLPLEIREAEETGSYDPNEISLESPAKKQRISLEGEEKDGELDEDMEEEDGPTTQISANIDKNEDSDEDADIGEDFIHQLELLQNQDISLLQELIVNMESQV